MNSFSFFQFAVAFCDKFELGKSVNTEQIAKIRKGRMPEIFDIFISNNFLFRHSYGQGKIMTKFPDKYCPSIIAFDSY